TGLSASVILALVSAAHSVPALMAGSAIVGLVYEAPRTVLGAAIGESITDPQRRAKIDALRFSWLNIGAGVAGAAGGLLAGSMGIPTVDLVNALAFAAVAVGAGGYMWPGA